MRRRSHRSEGDETARWRRIATARWRKTSGTFRRCADRWNIWSALSTAFEREPQPQSAYPIRTGTAAPIRLPPYRIPHAYRDTVKKELEEMEEEGIIERSESEWAFPIVLVKKKDDTLRMCVDYRRLNAVAEADAYPMPTN